LLPFGNFAPSSASLFSLVGPHFVFFIVEDEGIVLSKVTPFKGESSKLPITVGPQLFFSFGLCIRILATSFFYMLAEALLASLAVPSTSSEVVFINYLLVR